MENESSLSQAESEWWAGTIRSFRKKYIKEPSFYIDQRRKDGTLSNQEIISDVERLLVDSRELIYSDFGVSEAELNRQLLSHLFTTRDVPLKKLDEILEATDIVGKDLSDLSYEATRTALAKVSADYSASLFSYIYELSLSNTQSRRSRAGHTFEALLESALEIFGIPFETQKKLGKSHFETVGLGKKVDLVVPSVEAYTQSRSKCAVVTAKTTLRERWQEVVEELLRSGVPHIYLATLDEDIAMAKVATMRQHNITLVVKKSVWETKFRDEGSVEYFQHFFSKTLPHHLEVWPQYAKGR
jgi:hypothetical protein